MQRLDMLLVERGLVQSRTHAQRLIKGGKVMIKQGGQWQPVNKPGLKLAPDVELQLEADEADRFVSRGALKLAGALQRTGLDPTGMTALDIGQSTGGFSDCLLQAGVALVVGVEVGHDQLAERLRQDPRVVCYEGVNGRDLPHQQLLEHTGDGRGYDLAVMDVSFISQTKILPSLAPLLRPGGQLICLVKPQFEVGKAGIGRGGIVRDSSLYADVEQRIRDCYRQQGLRVKDYFESPIKGGDGNREFLIWAERPAV
ncbi:TlyA family RNA methyltransferase [Marinobacterium arenosum]|uniref:TlyA family RNA methyltransferase n=1 Tax=Marinobacterium arenosum TaxID=2862496 RepID=UPI001C98C102|nr:TlyA family RNA methyltransferase [Marinobacterium arenosum]MBY4677699.1 TlyA family RNA methyltransferase [Marinobacterium arenosum]